MRSEPNLEQAAKAGCASTGSRPRHEVEQIVTMARLELYNRGQSCGPKAIRERLDVHYAVSPLPSTRTISRVLTRQGLSNARTGIYDDDPGRPGLIHTAGR